MWTMDQLVERAHAALAAEYPGAPNGRVRDLPDRRSIRWYATTGMVDRPLGMRGRTALYGPRHLLQLVAIKRRQAAGRTLAEIQQELAGAPDEALAAVARVPGRLLTTDGADPETVTRPPFWKQAPVSFDISPEPGLPLPAAPAAAAPASAAPDPAAPAPASAAPDPAAPVLTGFPLGDGVILLVPGPVAGLDRAELAEAARPLLDLLASRALTNGRNE
jgi:DNA-binding transcriptional MerR regulator